MPSCHWTVKIISSDRIAHRSICSCWSDHERRCAGIPRLASYDEDPFALRLNNFIRFYSYMRAAMFSQTKVFCGDWNCIAILIGLSGFEKGKASDNVEVHKQLSDLIIVYNDKVYPETSYLELTTIIAHLPTFQIQRLRSVFSNTYTIIARSIAIVLFLLILLYA